MAYRSWTIAGDIETFATHVDAVITGGSVTARLEARTDQAIGSARLLVLSYERYSMTGGNRLGLTFSVLGAEGQLAVSAVCTGGSTGMFFKINTFGEEAFLEHAEHAVASYEAPRIDA